MFAASHFQDVTYAFPQGACWPGDSARMVRRVVARLQTIFIREPFRLRTFDNAPVVLALDEPDSEDAPPTGIIMVVQDRTHVIPLQCRKNLLRIEGEPIYTGDSGAVMRLARAVADAVEWYLTQMQAPKTPRRKQRA